MASVVAAITTSVDGYIAGPDDGPGKGLGEGGERLHYWVFGGPWTYASGTEGEATGEDAAWLRCPGSGRSWAAGGPTRRPNTEATRTPGAAVLHRDAPTRTG
jgi:hypothetical protein